MKGSENICSGLFIDVRLLPVLSFPSDAFDFMMLACPLGVLCSEMKSVQSTMIGIEQTHGSNKGESGVASEL